MSRGAWQIVKVALQRSHGPVAWLSAEPCECSTKKGRNTAQMCTSKDDPIVSSAYTGDGEGRTYDTLVGKVPSQLKGNELRSRFTAAVSQ